MATRDEKLHIGIEAGYDPGWPGGFIYIRNLVYTLVALEPERRPLMRLLPVNVTSAERARDLTTFGSVELAAPGGPGWVAEGALKWRRFVRRVVQPVVRKPLAGAYRGLDVTYPGFGRPIPGTPQMQWIPDFQHVHLPHLFSEQERARRDHRFEEIAKSRGVVILSSESARRDFEERYPSALATPRVWSFCTTLTDAELGGRDPHEAFGLPDFYLYVPNQFWAHKDHVTLFEALVLLRERGKTPAVVCTGTMEDPRDPAHMPRLRSYLSDNGLTDQVTLLGMVSRPDQIGIFRHAAAVVQPSTFEGWSTVVEDAKALGRPLVLSDIPVHREQTDEGAFFATGSPESLAEVLDVELDRMHPGPDESAERDAAERTRTTRLERAEGFLTYAREARAISRS
jgi:glycosyltransferase involved in cell wall biosynthesis